MKEASGELSMTLVVIIAVGVILTIFLAFREPIQTKINEMWNGWSDQADKANK